MKKNIISFLLTLTVMHIGAQNKISTTNKIILQKRTIDSTAYSNWPTTITAALSNNGMFASYVTTDSLGNNNLTLYAIGKNRKIEINDVNPYDASFTEDSRNLIFTKKNDTLCVINTANLLNTLIPNVHSYKISHNPKSNWIAYEKTTPPKGIYLLNIDSKKTTFYPSVISYLFTQNGKSIVLEKNNGNNRKLILVRLNEESIQPFWEGSGLTSKKTDKMNEQLAFIVKSEINNKMQYTLWYYKIGSKKAKPIITNLNPEIDSNYALAEIMDFSKDGQEILFKVKEKEKTTLIVNKSEVKLNVWSYKDKNLPSEQLKKVQESRNYLSSINIKSQKIKRIEDDYESIISNPVGNYVLISHNNGNLTPDQSNWNGTPNSLVYLKCITKNTSTRIDELDDATCTISPTGKYILYYKNNNYYSYTINKATHINLTYNIATSWTGIYGDDNISSTQSPRGIAGWIKDDKYVLIYDQFDIWLLDPSGAHSPINLTNGFGSKNKIIFDISIDLGEDYLINRNEKIILSAFDLNNKKNGFYELDVSKCKDPKQLYMGPYIFQIANNPYLPPLSGFTPLKAKKANIYLVRRMSSTESPNYFITSDFKSFKKISNLHPEEKYNWYTSELQSWKSLDGKTLQGILYKPQNFDSTQRYPLILHYYERKSDGLNAFIKPEILQGGCAIDIPTYASNGYLIFAIDIHFTIGDPMQSSYDAIVSAAEYAAQKTYVNPSKIGIQGCSFGGIQTNYLVTHTNIFAAACSASGLSNLISAYGGLTKFDGKSMQSYFETGQGRMGASLWKIPELYIKNSPIFSLDKVTTPFLIMHTTDDGVCNISQAIELFTGLRRLGKKAWLLEYENYDHGVYDKAGSDFSIRMMQFFDHYLKGNPAPIWMTRGIPAQLKGIEDGLRLDDKIKTPGASILIENQVSDSLK